jgi:hypothetical protein
MTNVSEIPLVRYSTPDGAYAAAYLTTSKMFLNTSFPDNAEGQLESGSGFYMFQEGKFMSKDDTYSFDSHRFITAITLQIAKLLRPSARRMEDLSGKPSVTTCTISNTYCFIFSL